MKKIVIYGAGGFGREVQWLIERINQKEAVWQIEGYLDDGIEPGTMINGYPVLGGIEKLREYQDTLAITCAVGNAEVREKIISKIKDIGGFCFPNLIDPDVRMSQFISLGEGNIICAGNILTVNIQIEDFVILNLSCTVGHDVKIASYVTVYSGVNISDSVTIGNNTEIGTGTKIIQGKNIGSSTILEAGAVVIRNIREGDCCGRTQENGKSSGRVKLLIFGASGHGKVLAEIASQTGKYEEILFLDDDAEMQKNNPSVIGDRFFPIANRGEYDVVIAVGNAQIRRQVQEKYEEAGVRLVSLVHPSACVAKDVCIGRGTVVMAGAVIQSGSSLGKGCIINTCASVDHDSRIADFVHVAVGVHLAGNVSVESMTWIGAGAVVSNNINIGKRVMIGAGAAVVKDIMESGTYVGVPAKRIK